MAGPKCEVRERHCQKGEDHIENPIEMAAKLIHGGVIGRGVLASPGRRAYSRIA
jgi:hypothetical protein